MGLGDRLLDGNGEVELVSLLDMDRSDFLGMYLNLMLERHEDVPVEDIGQATPCIDRFIDSVESLLSTHRFNGSVLDAITSSSVGRFVVDEHIDRLREDVYDCIRWYIEDLVEGKEDERMILGKINSSVHSRLHDLIDALNDEDLLIELAVRLVHIR